MVEDQKAMRTGVLLSLQRALLGAITPNMRAITVEWSKTYIRIWVYHDGQFTEEAVEDFDADVVTQVIADYPYPEKENVKYVIDGDTVKFKVKDFGAHEIVVVEWR